MRLIKFKHYDILNRVVIGIITGSISLSIFFSLEPLLNNGNDLNCFVLFLLVILGVVFGVMSIIAFFDSPPSNPNGLLGKILVAIGIVTPATIFYRLKLGDVITFYQKRYDGTSDTPVIKDSKTWIVTGKGRKYITINSFQMGAENESYSWNFTKERFDDKFDDVLYWHNVVDLGDKTIYSEL